ncbi:sugar transferase [Maritimibacter sp. UBA3975]|uniref:sugar transferase n=1 Tax=Maritimibacter sp. UBA3975 TaxID=1946833 RepID=UPI000C0B03EB|nr:sugar transferase [Maritimibacter sp. UBA3975]MAM63010.1 glycosyl transferase [Maritimibacter sp.]|tara:strand:- start:1059 stop:1736 length:678 start_codon:yes stop_codon:yes gene_type:complete
MSADPNIGYRFSDVENVGTRFKNDFQRPGGSALFWATKRAFDIVLSVILLILAALTGLALLVLNPFFNAGPLFFRQDRMGRDCEPFKVIKFRTMTHSASTTRTAKDPLETNRITRLGGLLRRMRLDELPQAYNVLRGEMSIIGPRPDTFSHAHEFSRMVPRYRERHLVRPGISGLAQVALGYAVGVDATRAKTARDLNYIRNAGFAMELRIIGMTFRTVFGRHGM